MMHGRTQIKFTCVLFHFISLFVIICHFHGVNLVSRDEAPFYKNELMENLVRAVAQSVDALSYKPEGRGSLEFFSDIILPTALTLESTLPLTEMSTRYMSWE